MTPEEVKRRHAIARRKSADPERLDQLQKAAMKECGGIEGIAREMTIQEGLAALLKEIRRE
ncbi:hypothetical protein ACQP10_08535 [Streptosporangium sandarakinum]|uniref:hypothetical protein n=1 Tax=Streptosporangium sandarakinum TaxID=1260955 RepID=UPI003D91BAB6